VKTFKTQLNIKNIVYKDISVILDPIFLLSSFFIVDLKRIHSNALHNKFWMRKNIYYVGLQQEKWF
jgi:hypothetical protein